MVTVILNKWRSDGPGYPFSAFFMGNGNEVAALELVAKSIGVKLKTTPSYSNVEWTM